LDLRRGLTCSGAFPVFVVSTKLNAAELQVRATGCIGLDAPVPPFRTAKYFFIYVALDSNLSFFGFSAMLLMGFKPLAAAKRHIG
jgi:hypothetical protein